ncbi:hypothetical protein T11_14570 [Trichinella zimbabwensis]|uniref:Uncharacterized protein n=1 Tax=Trichinella zimbabwensis TaxID=268475 RepID=A0A0V1GDK6_9BILA|nr:hypothetical protein T11_14570 [Trichinella zimbabwensis]
MSRFVGSCLLETHMPEIIILALGRILLLVRVHSFKTKT